MDQCSDSDEEECVSPALQGPLAKPGHGTDHPGMGDVEMEIANELTALQRGGSAHAWRRPPPGGSPRQLSAQQVCHFWLFRYMTCICLLSSIPGICFWSWEEHLGALALA